MIQSGSDLSLGRQCQLLQISRSSFYYQPIGESLEALDLMQQIDRFYMQYPFYSSRQMVRQLRREGFFVRRHRVRRYYLSSDATRFFVSGRDHGLGNTPCSGPAIIQ